MVPAGTIASGDLGITEDEVPGNGEWDSPPFAIPGEDENEGLPAVEGGEAGGDEEGLKDSAAIRDGSPSSAENDEQGIAALSDNGESDTSGEGDGWAAVPPPVEAPEEGGISASAVEGQAGKPAFAVNTASPTIVGFGGKQWAVIGYK